MKFLSRLLTFSLRHPAVVISGYIVLSVLCWRMVTQIQVDTDIANLLPDENPHVQSMHRITSLWGSEDRVEVLFPASYEGWLADAQRFAERMMLLERNGMPVYSAFELQNDTRLLRDNILYFLTDAELDRLETRLAYETEQLRLRSNPFYVEFDEDRDEVEALDNWFIDIPPEFYLNRDSTQVLMRFSPTGSKADVGFVEHLFAQTDSLAWAFAQELPIADAEILYGGNLYHHILKFRDIQATLNFAVVFGVISILGFLMLYSMRLARRFMRNDRIGVSRSTLWLLAWSIAVVIIILLPLVVALLITYASGFLMFANLNIMTTVLIAILLGVTLDYVLHFFSTYMRNRAAMRDLRALMEAFYDCGKALLISCLTSGLAMLVLLFSSFRGFFEFGALFFVGIVSTYFLTITLFSVLIIGLDRLVVRLESRVRSRVDADNNTSSLRTNLSAGTDAGFIVRFLNSFKRPVFYTAVLLLALALLFVPRIEFEYAFNELEPRTPTDSRFNEVRRTFDTQTRNDAAFFLFETREQAIQAATLLADTLRFETIGHIESIHDRLPLTPEEQLNKLQRIAAIRMALEDPLLRGAIDELSGYEWWEARTPKGPDAPKTEAVGTSVADTGQLAGDHTQLLRMLRTAAHQTQPVSLDSIPDSIKQRFITSEGEVGNLVIIYPNMMLAHGRASIRFKEDAAVVHVDGRNWYAASTSIIGASILTIMQEEASWLMMAPLAACLLCLIVFFRSWKWGFLTFLPLFASLMLLIGGMAAFGMKFNIYNIIVLPAVLGVGADNGIHLFHQLRLMIDGKGARSYTDILTHTGTFITASSFTTTLGFAGLIFTNHPGLQSMGWVAVGGILLSLLCAVAAAGLKKGQLHE